MILQIKVIPNAKKERVLEEESCLKVYLTVPARQGKANKALIKLLSAHFNVQKRQVVIIKGEKSHNKVVEVQRQEVRKPR